MDPTDEGGGDVVEKGAQRGQSRHQHDIHHGDNRGDGQGPRQLEVGHDRGEGVGALTGHRLDELLDGGEHMHGVEHEPHDRRGDDEHDARGEAEQEARLHH